VKKVDKGRGEAQIKIENMKIFYFSSIAKNAI
jgi:hypothetical protein